MTEMLDKLAGSVPSVRLVWPAALLLLVPAAAALWRLARGWGRAVAALRIAAIVLLAVVLADPQIRLGGDGVDLVVLVDRSASMTQADRRECDELIATVAGDRGPGDRLAVVAFARQADTQLQLTATGDYAGDPARLSSDGSDLANGLETALAGRDRPARIVVLSDGQSTGGSAMPAARRAAAWGTPIDYRLFERPKVNDVAVVGLDLPPQLDQGEPFQFAATLWADQPCDVGYTLSRPDGQSVTQRRRLTAGANRIVFRDLAGGRGVVGYQFRVDGPPGDRPENNVARGVSYVKAPPALLVVNNTGRPDNLTRALAAGQLNVEIAAARSADLSSERLAGFRAVVLENVAAAELGPAALRNLSSFVTDLGGGLMMTGGRRSFGSGGYFLSELDRPGRPLLPVSMELRQEHRKMSAALAIVMDRSGSMAVPVAGGKTKMDLANLAAAEAIGMLSPMDAVSVVAVDSSAHLIVPLTAVADAEGLAERVRRIQSMGGGIFVYVGLVAGGKQLQDATQSSRHLILFADASDSEEPGDYRKLLEQFERMGVTVSVIGLGQPTDTDAELLRDIAKRGRGNISFTNDVNELPRLFKQDTVTFVADTFVREPAGVQTLLDLQTLGDFQRPQMPKLAGYNLTYPRGGAMLAFRTADENQSPVLAFWQRGLGRTMAATFEVDGESTGALAGWADYPKLLITSARWLLGQGEPDGVRVSLSRQGHRGVVRVELDPETVALAGVAPTATLIAPGGDNGPAARRLTLNWTGESTAEAQFDLDQTGVYQAAIEVDGRVLRSGAMTLPYSPEFAPRVDLPGGREVLDAVAAVSGGRARLSVEGLFAPTGRRLQWRSLRPALLWLAMLALVVEVAGRRLGLFTGAGVGWFTRSARSLAAGVGRLPLGRALDWLPRPRLRRRAGVATAESSSAPPAGAISPPPPPASPGQAPSPAPGQSPAQASSPPPPPKPQGSALERAKRQARRGFGS